MLHIFKFFLLNFYKSNKKLILFYMIFNLILYPINSIYIPRLFSELINKVSVKKNCRKGIDKELNDGLNFINDFKNKNIPNLIVFISIISIIAGLLFKFKRDIYSKIFPKYKMWLRKHLFSKTLEKKNYDFEEQKVGKEIMRIEDLIYTIREIFNFTIVNVVEFLTMGLVIIIFLSFKSKLISFLVFLQIFLIGLILYFSFDKIKEVSLQKISSFYNIADNIDNSFNNLSNILINSKIKNEVNKNQKFSNTYKEKYEKSLNILNNLLLKIRFVTVLTLMIILIVAYRMNKKKQISSVNFTLIVIILLHFQNYLYNQSWDISMIMDRVVQIKYHEEYLTDLLMPDHNSKNLNNIIKEGKIDINNISFKYKKTNKYVIKNLSLSVLPNEKIAIIGKSGSGKSTLVKLLIRFFKLDKGIIKIDNVSHTDINIEHLRNNINYVNQNTLLFDKDIYYNISYGINNSKNNKNYINTLLEKYDLRTIYNNLEHGLETEAGPKGSKLSLGMQKVTILMRGLMRNSKIIIFDEPLAGLDQTTREKVINLIIGETENKTIMVITHDQEIIPYMDRVVNLKDINNV